MDAAAALSLYLYLQQLYDLGTPIHLTISLSCSHQTRPRMPAITRLAAFEVLSFVLCVCMLGMERSSECTTVHLIAS